MTNMKAPESGRIRPSSELAVSKDRIGSEPPIGLRSGQAVAESRPGRVMAAHPVDAPAGRCGRRAQVDVPGGRRIRIESCNRSEDVAPEAVSYTHLTLPTIYSV